ncbi:FeoC-like transcriptional regulator [Clostridium rectalis]|uniref:FeoC-like transcriptional regulator n=1 Tax=Clostridium rectalis TaxID=2040295 RepID=UPI000F6415D1|nr:FeoC-like transcriptional regulator [Clostridium rectalis]
MLTKVLKEIAAGELKSKEEICKKLSLSESMLEGIMDQLIQMGYIEQTNGELSCDCSGCTGSCHCSNIKMNMWTISQKGKSILNK